MNIRDFDGKQESSDYPIYAKAVGRALQKKECDLGILICGTGIGISIAANKMKGIRAALCHDCFSAEEQDYTIMPMYWLWVQG